MADKYISQITPLGSSETYKLKAYLLKTGRTFKVQLDSTDASTAFDGSANITDIGVTGILPIANGGTGANSRVNAYKALAYAGEFTGDIDATNNEAGIWGLGADNSYTGESLKTDLGITTLPNWSIFYQLPYVNTQLIFDGNPGQIYIRDREGSSSSLAWKTWKVLKQKPDNAGHADTAAALSSTGTTAQFWRGDNTWSNELSGGQLKITNYSNTVTIGSGNASYMHFNNSADIPFYFNKSIWVDGDLYPYGTSNTRSLGSSSKRWKSLFIGTADSYGGTAKPIYWKNGVPTELSETVGATDKPVFLSSGTITASTSTIGSGIIPIYMSSGQIKASTSTVGSFEKPAYLNEGTITALNPVWLLTGGTATANNEDLNAAKYKAIGNYYSDGDAKSKTILNSPFGAAASTDCLSFTLKTEASLGTDTTYLRQLWRSYNSGVEAERTSGNSGSSWSTWRTKVFKNSDATTTQGNGEQPIYIAANGQAVNTTYHLKAHVEDGSASHLAYYSAARTIDYTPNITFINGLAADVGTGKIYGLEVAGSVTGTADKLKAGEVGILQYGDAGPQLRFDSNGQKGAIIFTEYDNMSDSGGASFHFVTNQQSAGAAIRARYLTAGDNQTAGRIRIYQAGAYGDISANDKSSYGALKLTQAKGSYVGLLIGNSSDSLTIMDSGTSKGLYAQGTIGWLIYGHNTNKTVGIRTSSITSGYDIELGGTTHTSKLIHIDINSGTNLDNSRPLMIGPLTGANLAIGRNAIQARNNGEESILYLNYNAGSIQFGSSTSLTAPTKIFGTVTPGATDTYNLGTASLSWKTLNESFVARRVTFDMGNSPITAGWRRVCKINAYEFYLNCMILITGRYSSAKPAGALVSIHSANTSNITLNLLSGYAGSHLKKLRLVSISGSQYWLDIYTDAFNDKSDGTHITYGNILFNFYGNVTVSDVQTSLTTQAATGGYEIDLINTAKIKLGAELANDYWGMTTATGANNAYIRTTTVGLIPYQSGGVGDGHSTLGTSGWRFKTAYINDIYSTTVHANLDGNADTATAFSSNATVTLTGDTTGTSAGSTKSWSVPTVTSALTVKGGRVATADSAHAAADYSKMYLRIATGSMKTNKPTFSVEGETPAAHDGHILEFHWDNSGIYNEQLALSNTNAAMSIRACPNSATWHNWTPILTSTNVLWSAWGDGTTAGPTAKLNIGGTTITSAAIPSASTSASGIVTTGAQQFKGRKKFGYLELYGEDAGTAKRYLDIVGRNNAGTQVAEIYYDFGNATNITTGIWNFRQWSPNSTANTATSGGYETYSLPTVTAGLSSGNHGYSILTTKNTVTVAQGGTGNTSFAKDRLIYSESTSKLSAHGSLIISTETTYASRTITPLLRVNGILMANDQVESAAYFMNNGTGTSGSHGYYLYRNNAYYGRLFVTTVGTVATADAAGTAGIASLYLGNNIAQPAAGATTAGANNAYGRILLYGTGTTYTILRSNPNGSRTIYLPHAAKDGYLVCKTVTTAVGGTGTPIYVDANGVIQECTTYGSATAATANAVKTTLMTNASTAIYVLGATGTTADTSATVYKGYRTSTVKVYFRGDTGVLMGAAWNDYAEYRQAKDDIEIKPGRVVKEVGDETLELTTERLQRGCSIVSNTFGISIGESETNKLPLAVAGRVLAYPYENREDFKNHIGWPVCSGPNGTVSIMTEEEEMKYPSRIIGIISAVPDYEIWHGGADVIVDGRVWIKVR